MQLKMTKIRCVLCLGKQQNEQHILIEKLKEVHKETAL